jgi:hypothetical protein
VKKNKYVKVEWKDAASEDKWTKENEIDPGISVVVTVGHLQQKTKDAIVVALSHDELNEEFSNWITIPHEMIVSVVELVQKKRK